MFFRRGVADDDPWLQAKLWLFSLGALLALMGMFLENRWVIGGAGLLLGAGVLLRFIPGPREDGAEDRRHEAGGTPGPDHPDQRRG